MPFQRRVLGIKKVNQENQELKVTLQRSVRREECVRKYSSKKVHQKSVILGNTYTGVYSDSYIRNRKYSC